MLSAPTAAGFSPSPGTNARLIEIDAATETVTGSTTFEPGDVAVTDDRAYVSLRSGDSLVVLDISGG
jgi:hypothetical protein